MAQTGYTPIQLYYSSTTTNAPTAGNLANGELAINITDGKLFYKDNANAVQVIGWKTVPATAGGTGQTSYAVGDLLYADTTTTLAKLPDVATGNALISGGVSTAPSWGKIGLTTHVSGTLPVANGGTNLTSFTANGVVYASSTSALATGSALTFDGSNLLIGGTSNSRSARILSENAAGQQLALRYTGIATWYENVDSSGNLSWDKDGSEKMRLTSGGDLLVGTTSTGGKITAAVANNAAFQTAASFTNATNADFNIRIKTSVTDIGCSTSTPLTFSTANTEGFRLDSGNLLVGKTALSATTVGCQLTGNGEVYSASSASTSASNSYLLYSTGAGAFRFYVGLDGTINATSIVISAISDQRLKENVRDIDTGLNAIMALKPRRFDWKEGKGQDKKNAAGFIAQEFEDVFPECVSTSMAGENGIEYKNINHESLIPTLVKAIQEQQAIITQLQADLAVLKGTT